MDFTTQYLGKQLRSPIVASASPLSQQIDDIRRLEDAGVGAVVLYSLFEEQLALEQIELHHHMTFGTESYAESLTYFPEPKEYKVGPDGYLEHIRRAKEAVEVPIIASLNGRSIGGWTKFASQMEQAGADAIELNIYSIPTDLDRSSADIEQDTLDIVKAVKSAVTIPVAVKLSPYYSNMANMAKRLGEAGADGLVLFNRFYQPDIDLEALEVKPHVLLSTPQAMRLPLRWIAILYGRLHLDFAATSGVHHADDVIKLLMVGANVTMMASALMRNGIDHVRSVEAGVRHWLEANEYESVQQLQGSLSMLNSRDAAAFERAQYMRAINSIPDEYRRSYRF
jgi:dihydroorotate dehydrogenase (fumarate)